MRACQTSLWATWPLNDYARPLLTLIFVAFVCDLISLCKPPSDAGAVHAACACAEPPICRPGNFTLFPAAIVKGGRQRFPLIVLRSWHLACQHFSWHMRYYLTLCRTTATNATKSVCTCSVCSCSTTARRDDADCTYAAASFSGCHLPNRGRSLCNCASCVHFKGVLLPCHDTVLMVCVSAQAGSVRPGNSAWDDFNRRRNASIRNLGFTTSASAKAPHHGAVGGVMPTANGFSQDATNAYLQSIGVAPSGDVASTPQYAMVPHSHVAPPHAAFAPQHVAYVPVVGHPHSPMMQPMQQVFY